MTVRELSKLYYLQKLIERDAEHLAELEARLQPGAMNIDGMPKSPTSKNMMEEIVPLIIEVRERLAQEHADFLRERNVIERYIQGVEDYQIKLILSYRFVDLKTWRQIALLIGGNNTEDGVKKACYRFLKNH